MVCSSATCACAVDALKCSGQSCGRRKWDFEDGLVAGVLQLDNYTRSVSAPSVAASPAGGTKALRLKVTAGAMDELIIHLKFCGGAETVDLFGKQMQARLYFESQMPSTWGTRGFSSKPPVLSSNFAGPSAWKNYHAFFGGPNGETTASRDAFVTPELTIDLAASGAWDGVIWIDDIEILD
jgi:hypothetical protein